MGWIAHSFNEDTDYYVTADEVREIEMAHKARVAAGQSKPTTDETDELEVDYAR